MKKYKIRTLSNISPSGLEVLSNSSCILDENCEDPDGILVRSTKFNQNYLNESLKAISRAGSGVNNIPVDLCTKKGVVVFNTPGANSNAVKELVLAALLLSSRNVFSSVDFVNNLQHFDKMEELEPFLEENKKKFKIHNSCCARYSWYVKCNKIRLRKKSFYRLRRFYLTR